MKKLITLAVATAALTAGMANAATDGALDGAASSGTLDVNVTVAPMVKISGLDDITLNIDAATINSNFGSTRGLSQFCVFSNVDALGSYNVDVTSPVFGANGNPFALLGAASGTNLNVTASYYDNAAYDSIASTFQQNGGALDAMQNTRGGQARATTLDCNGSDNSSLQVGVRNSEALAALADTYSSTLTVTVSVP